MRDNRAFSIDFSNTSQSHDYALDAMLRGMGRFTAVERSSLVDWTVLHPSQQELRVARYTKAAQLLEGWMSESTAYDEKVGDILEQELREKLKFGRGGK